MTLLGQWNPSGIPSSGSVKFNDLWGYTDCDGKEYVIAGSSSMIHFLDISDPGDPIEVDRIAGGNTTVWRDIKTYQDRAYAVADNADEGLIIIDLSFLPDSVSVTYQDDEFMDMAHNVYVDEEHGRLYVAGANSQENGIIILDIKNDPDNPSVLLNTQLQGGYVHDIFVKDHIGYCSQGFQGMTVWDFSDVNDISLLAGLSSPGYNHSSWSTEDDQYLIYAQEIPKGLDLSVVDISDLSNGNISIAKDFKFPLLAPLDSAVTPHNPMIRDDFLMVSYYEDGIQVFDISDPLDPQPWAHYDTHINSSYRGTTGNWGIYGQFNSGIIAGSDVQNGIFLLQMNQGEFSQLEKTVTPTLEINISGPTSFCANDTMTVIAAGAGFEYQWFFNGNAIEGERGLSYKPIENGLYTIEATDRHCQADTTIDITVYPLSYPLILDADGMLSTDMKSSYQWSFNKELIPGSINQELKIDKSGLYSVQVQDLNGCYTSSDTAFYLAYSTFESRVLDDFEILPNPANNEIRVYIKSASKPIKQTYIISSDGKVLRNFQVNDTISNDVIDISNLLPGKYFYTVEAAGNFFTRGFLKL